MSFNLDDANIGGQLKVGTGIFPAIGEGAIKTNGSAGIEGPIVIGEPTRFTTLNATVNIGPLTNSDVTRSPIIPGSLCSGVNNPYSLAVVGASAFMDNLDCNMHIAAGRDIRAQGNVISNCGGHILAAKKNFDIKHPSKKGYRLRHTCPEAPYNDVYIRGKVKNKDKIELPSYWKNSVDRDSITVQLQPIGAHQDVIIKRIDDKYIYLQAKGGMPINCYYHVFAERSDGEKLIPEYKGKTPEDYPGNNDEYSVSGYHYDVRQTED